MRLCNASNAEGEVGDGDGDGGRDGDGDGDGDGERLGRAVDKVLEVN